MSVINVLDESTINKIAAGEVVERPVSVVKELVENAIDAGSTNISIEIKGGGIDYIRVADNGSGIDHDSIPAAFLRHATSKISSIEDLASITSLGFRGEALSSIAAVAAVELITKKREDVLGYRYCINGGKEMSFDEAGTPDGTTIIVRNLFYNTPARRKFLKSATTESSYITELVERLLLSHPKISFKYIVNGSVKLASNGLGDILSNVYTVFGRDISRSLVDVSFVSPNCTISGFIGKPETARGNRNFELFFVNDRFIKSRILSSAVEAAYKPYLMLHRFPFVILYLDIPSQLLDVNVHPAKTEIRFLEEQSIYSCIFDTVTEGITRRELIPEAVIAPKKSTDEIPAGKGSNNPKPAFTVPPEPFETRLVKEYQTEEIKKAGSEHIPEQYDQETLFKEGLLGEVNKPSIKLIGQVFDTYWIIQFEDKMYVIDQHAAHEKVLYERFSKQIAQNDVIPQMISPPVIVTLTPAEEDTVKKYIDVFASLGFTIEHFGGREYAISSAPSDLFGMTGKDYFLNVLDGLENDRSITQIAQVKDRIATMACKAAVKGNMKMSYAEADALICELFTLDNPYNCPHGRPTVISFSETELEKLFKRIV